MAETAAQDVSIRIEPWSGRSIPCGEEPERYGAALRAMIMSDAMGAYDLLEHHMTLLEISVAERGIASQTALVALQARLSGARELETLHGPGCLLKLDDPFLRTLVDKFHLKISDLHVRAADKLGREQPHLLRA